MRMMVGAVLVTAAVGISAACGGDDDDSGAEATGEETAAATSSVEGADRVNELTAGLEQSGSTIGDPDAPVEIVEFGDLQCPFCAQASEEITPELVEQFVEPGTAKLTIVPLAFLGPDSETGAIAVEAAALQDGAFTVAEILYANQEGENDGWLTEDLINDAVEAGGLDTAQFQEDFASDEAAEAIFENQTRAQELDVTSTPTYVIEGPSGTETVTGAQDIGAFEQAIDEVQ